MKIIYAKQNWLDLLTKSSIMLCGPTPRLQHPYPSWRPEALQILEKNHYDGTVLVPEDESGAFQGSYIDQIKWEEEALNNASCILFWFARKLPEMPAFTTNTEWGAWHRSGKVVFGAPDWAEKVKYQKHYAQKYHIPMSRTLEGTILLAMDMANKLNIK